MHSSGARVEKADITWTTRSVQEPPVYVVPRPGKPLVVYYYRDAATAYNEDEEIRKHHRRAFSQNGADYSDLGQANNFCGTTEELKDIKQEMKRREIEETDSWSLFTRGNIGRILKECPRDYEYIVIDNA
jgi:hypothetical protein